MNELHGTKVRPGRSLLMIGLIAWALKPCLAQANAVAQRPISFDVASVRQVKGEGLTNITPFGTSLFHASNVSMKILVELAYGLDDGQIEHMPSWMDEILYDVTARTVDQQILTKETLRAPLQRLLQDRFHLQASLGSKVVSGYSLSVASSGAKLKPSSGGFEYANFLADALVAKGISTATLAAMLARPLGKPVRDDTGISGTFNVELHYAPLADPESALPSLTVAVKDTLGLEVRPTKVSATMLRIDHLDRSPTEN